MLALEICPVSPAEISDNIKEKNDMSAAKAQTLTGTRVLTGTPPSMVMALSLVVPALTGRTPRAARRSAILAESESQARDH